MFSRLRIGITVLGVFFALQGLRWIYDPGRAAASLGMPLLDGVARSTQIGDLATFFLTVGATTNLGAWPGRARLLFLPAGMLGVTAVLRTVAWTLHGAELAVLFIAIELAAAGVLVAAATRLDAGVAPPPA